MDCSYISGVECVGPSSENRHWICPVHHARLTVGWTKLCRQKPGYYRHWMEGYGPGQQGTPPKKMGISNEKKKPAVRRKHRLAVCHRCPEGLWGGNKPNPGCPAGAHRICAFDGKLRGERRLCKHWPE